jgi:ATP-dependent DNA helicase RecG
MKDVEAAERTLKYDEFLRFFTAVYLRRNSKENSLSKQPRQIDMRKLQAAISSLPYTLT